MTVGEIRELLSRTGPLITKTDDDPGHITHFWRKTVVALCDLIDTLPADVGEQLAAERRAHSVTRKALESEQAARSAVERYFKGHEETTAKIVNDLHRALQLLQEATPRMKSLNNQMSPGWLARAEELMREAR